MAGPADLADYPVVAGRAYACGAVSAGDLSGRRPARVAVAAKGDPAGLRFCSVEHLPVLNVITMTHRENRRMHEHLSGT